MFWLSLHTRAEVTHTNSWQWKKIIKENSISPEKVVKKEKMANM